VNSNTKARPEFRIFMHEAERAAFLTITLPVGIDLNFEIYDYLQSRIQ